MAKDFREKACAKVNFHLEVSGKRENGYHDIVSVMASIDLFDVLELTEIDEAEDVSVTIIPAGGRNSDVLVSISPEKNLITKAATAYFAGSGKGVRATVSLEKNIPAGAGMGGGSADAAAMLRLLNRACKLYSPEDLEILSSRIGADVPFCLRGGVSVCEGIGDIVNAANLSSDPWVLVLNDGIHVDTALAYSMVDGEMDILRKSRKHVSVDDLKRVLSGPLVDFRDHFYNDFEVPVFLKHPVIGSLKDHLYSEGAVFSAMTGSGSTVIALFDSRAAAEKASAVFDGKIKFTALAGIVKNRIY